MRVLLDSQALIAWLSDGVVITEAAFEAIADPRNVVYVSAASIWEIAIKVAKGTLKVDVAAAMQIVDERFDRLDIVAEDAIRAAALPDIHRDPFDRMLVAQAIERGLVIVTADRTIPRYGVATMAL